MTRREMLRASLAAAAWSLPAVVAVGSTPASAGTPPPQAQAPGTPAPDGRGGGRVQAQGGLLPRTGGSIGWLAIAAAGAMGTGGAALKRARSMRARASVLGGSVAPDASGAGDQAAAETDERADPHPER